MDIVPSILAPKGNRARSELAVAFQHYFENYTPGQTQSSAMIQTRHTVNTKYGVSLHDQGRLEVGTLLGILANTIPSTFYMLIRVYSDPELLQDIRDELEATSVSSKSGEKKKRTLHVIIMREKCNLLYSTFQELLRVHAQGASARFVREDTLLDNQYLLRKGMVVQMPMAVMHSDPSIWGPDAGNFNPRRFLKQQNGDQKSKQYLTAYRPFGGGTSMCPGRHFVALEVLALTAYMVLQFDLMPSDGQWVIPPQKQESLSTNVFPPARDIKVKATRRQRFKDVDWDFVMK